MLKLTDRQWAYFTLRLTLGVNFFMHGLTRVVSGIGFFAEKASGGFDDTPLPAPLVHGFLVVLPVIELIIGTLMVLGLFTRYALIAGALLITVLTFGTTARQDWGTAGSQLVYAIAFFILLFALDYNRLCIDKKSHDIYAGKASA